MKKLFLIALTAILCSCTNETDEVSSTDKDLGTNPKSKTTNLTTTSSNGNIVAVIYPYEICSSGDNYAVYATASEIVPFERQVSVVVYNNVQTQNIVESFICRIPANQASSMSFAAFKNFSSIVGDASVIPTKVFVNGTNVSSQYELITSNQNVLNCVAPALNWTNPCNLDSDDDGRMNCEDGYPQDPTRI